MENRVTFNTKPIFGGRQKTQLQAKKPHVKQHFSKGETELSYVQAEKPQREVEFLYMKTLIWSLRTHYAHKTRVVTISYRNFKKCQAGTPVTNCICLK